MKSPEKFFTNGKLVVILALIPCALFGSALATVKLGYSVFMIESTPDKALFAAYRFSLAGLAILVFSAAQGKKIFDLNSGDLIRLALLGVVFTTLHYICFYLGLSNTTGVKASIINSTSVFFSVVIVHFIHKNDRLSARTALGCIIGFIGVIAVNIGKGSFGSGFRLDGEMLLLLAMLFASIGGIYGKRVSVTIDAMVMTGWQLLFGGFILWLAAKLMGGSLPHVTSQGIGLLAYLIFVSSVAISLNAVLYKYNPVSKITVFAFTMPLFGVLFSGIILGESLLDMQNLIALIFVSIGVWLVNSRKKPKEPVPALRQDDAIKH